MTHSGAKTNNIQCAMILQAEAILKTNKRQCVFGGDFKIRTHVVFHRLLALSVETLFKQSRRPRPPGCIVECFITSFGFQTVLSTSFNYAPVFKSILNL